VVPEFQVRTTGELRPEEIAGLTRLFETVFAKPCPEDVFRRKFAGGGPGGSVHSLMFLGGELIGAFSAIPLRYRFFGRTLLFAITADLMIDPRHRGAISRVQRLAEGMYQRLAGDGVAFVFCCLREEIFQFHKAVSRWRAVGKVHYYAAPIRLPYLGPASSVVRASVRIWNRLSPGPAQLGDAAFEIEKVNDAAFAAWRYGIFPSGYVTVALRGGTAVYATELYYPIAGVPPQVRLALLIDVAPLTQASFDEAVLTIRRREPGLTVLAYQGSLPFRPCEMIRIPEKYEKPSWTLAGRVLRPDQVDDRIFELRHWNINLSNGDLV
jgi:hypothetical protein